MRIKIKKRISLKFRTKKKGLHSNLVRFFARNCVLDKNKGLRQPFVCSKLLLNLQRRGPCRNFAYYSMLIILSWRPKGGSHDPMAPPKYAPAHGRDCNAMLAYDCNSQKSLTCSDCVPVILAKSSRQKNRYRTAGSLTRCEIVLKRGLLVLNLQKPPREALQLGRLSVFAFETITLRNFEQKLYEANASVKRNTGDTIKQL